MSQPGPQAARLREHYEHQRHNDDGMPVTRRDQQLIGISAVTYLILCLWLGPHGAFYLVLATAIITVWWALCRRFPFVGVMTIAMLTGFFSGLFGYRSGGCYRSYYVRRNRRR